MSNVTDPERRLFNPSQTFSNLNPKVPFEPAQQGIAIETSGRNDTGDSVARPERIDLHTGCPDQITNPVGHRGTPRENLFLTGRRNVIESGLELKKDRQR